MSNFALPPWPLSWMREHLRGSWDGDENECHGVIRWRGRDLKIEMRRVRTDSTPAIECTVFCQGQGVGTSLGEGPKTLLQEALLQARQALDG